MAVQGALMFAGGRGKHRKQSRARAFSKGYGIEASHVQRCNTRSSNQSCRDCALYWLGESSGAMLESVTTGKM